MIKNEKQYRITRAKADDFAQALEELKQPAPSVEGRSAGDASAGGSSKNDSSGAMHPRLRKAQEEALRSQHKEMLEELASYEALSGRTALEIDSFERLHEALIQARIAAGLTQKELAGRLGLKEQQIQRYEATDYASASWERIQEVLGALRADVKGEIRLPAS